MISLRPARLSRYAAIARLLVKYGRTDVVRQIGLDPVYTDHAADEPTSAAGPESLADDLEALGPTFIKLGQLLSTRADFLPPAYMAALERLQDGIQPLPYEAIEEIVERELGVRISKAFSEFDERAFATASIGQVHRAKLRDGRSVVVKVQRPDIRERIGEDLDALQELAHLLDGHTDMGRRVRFEQIVESLREVMTRELDYRQEAENSRNLRKNLEQFQEIVIPRVIEGYYSEKVLTTEFIEGAKITEVSPVVLVELDRPKLADGLFQIYLHQVLVDGLFHADPHPGNLVLTCDGRIALFDFGMVARVTPELQHSLIKLLMALGDGRAEETASAALAIGRPYEKGRFREAEFRERVAQMVAANQGRPLEQMNTGRILMELNAVAGETGLKLPSAIVMLGKTLLNLDKVVEVLDPSFDPNLALRQHAGEIFQSHSRSRWSFGRLYQSLLESAEFVERMPERLNKVADLVANNKLKVEVDAFDERQFIAGMQKIANRITTGLVLAAMIIGASLMMHLPVERKIFGYPAVAFLFFLAAAIAAGVLLWRITFHDQPEDR
jgi:predicted unusual protein kinase regulating ubiquinone biosynthesis (AarF/ABC1/UbiB family)